MPGRNYRIARIAGIPVGVNPLWLVIVAIITVGLGASYYPSEIPGISPAVGYALGLLSALLLFASVLAHELGHALVARRRGVTVKEIDLWLLGGVAQMGGRPQQPGDELAYAAAGPLVTCAVAALFGALALLLPRSTPGTLKALVDYEAYMNIAILVFNLLPAFPLDGGRVARALLWRARGDLLDATEVAAMIGRAFGWLLVALGFVSCLAGDLGGLWLAMIGGFLVLASAAERVHEEQVQAVTGLTVADLMSPPVVIQAESTLADAVHQLERCDHDAFAVVGHNGQAVGLLTMAALEGDVHSGYATLVGDIADRDPDLFVVPSLDAVRLLENLTFLRKHYAVVVNPEHRPVGIVSEDDVQRTIRWRRLASMDGNEREVVYHG